MSKYTSIGNGITADYDYDFERKRLSKTVSNVRRDYVYAGNQVINEYLADNLNASYGIGSGEIVKSDFAGEGTRNYFSDALGSITSLADSSSSLISRNDYDSFGEIISSTGSSQNSITYTGQRLDVESGLMALGNGERYYNPSYGRFIQQDSYAGMPDMPESLNRFSYTYNNPNSYTDPSGNVPKYLTETNSDDSEEIAMAEMFDEWDESIINGDDGDWVKTAKLFGTGTLSTLGGLLNSGNRAIRGAPGMVAEPFARKYDETLGTLYDYSGTSYEDRYYYSNKHRSIQGMVLQGKSVTDATYEFGKEEFLNTITFGIKGVVESATTNSLDYSEGKISRHLYNLRQGRSGGDAIQLLVGARMGKGAANSKAFAGTRTSLKTQLSNVKTNLKSKYTNTVRSLKENLSKARSEVSWQLHRLKTEQRGSVITSKVKRTLLDDIVDDANLVAANGGEITSAQRMTLKQNSPVVQRRGEFANKIMRKEFEKIEHRLIKQWEKNTGKSWTINPVTGKRSTPHHIIPLESGGANKWWNLVPTNGRLPNHSLPGIPGPHAAGGVLRNTIQRGRRALRPGTTTNLIEERR